MIIRSILDIMAEMEKYQRSKHPRLTNYNPTSVLSTINESVADQIRKLEVDIQRGLDALSLYTATGADLDFLVRDRLVEGRLLGARSLGVIIFGRKNALPYAVDIPKGTICTAATIYGSIKFQTTKDATMNINETQVSVDAEAVIPGVNGNVASNTIVNMPTPIPGVDFVFNPYAFSGGEDIESDEALRERYIYAINMPGRATPNLIEQHLLDSPNVQQVAVTTVAPGDVVIVTDCPMADDVIQSVSNIIRDNIAAGIISIGCMAAQIINGDRFPDMDESQGGKIFIRTRSYIQDEEYISGQFLDGNGITQDFSITIPAHTVEGVGLKVVMDKDTIAQKITSISYSGSKSYDILIGLGEYPYLFVQPIEVPVSIFIKIKKEASFEQDLEWNIEQSIRAWVEGFRINEDIEYADLIKTIFRDSRNPSKNFEGIDDIMYAYITGKNSMITSFGSKIVTEPDEKIVLSSVSVISE
mgnify:CR=1 FL=1